LDRKRTEQEDKLKRKQEKQQSLRLEQEELLRNRAKAKYLKVSHGRLSHTEASAWPGQITERAIQQQVGYGEEDEINIRGRWAETLAENKERAAAAERKWEEAKDKAVQDGIAYTAQAFQDQQKDRFRLHE
jgi:hypothetical protein